MFLAFSFFQAPVFSSNSPGFHSAGSAPVVGVLLRMEVPPHIGQSFGPAPVTSAAYFVYPSTPASSPLTLVACLPRLSAPADVADADVFAVRTGAESAAKTTGFGR